MPRPSTPAPDQAAGFTILEVLVAALLISTVIGSIVTMNAQAIHTLHATRQAAGSSQVLQQRVESIRARPWPEVSSSTALAALMQRAAESQRELSDLDAIERMEVSVLAAGSVTPVDETRSFTLQRQRGVVRIEKAGDLGDEAALLFESSLTWNDMNGPHRRKLRTLVCRAGLTRSGIFGSSFGRPASP